MSEQRGQRKAAWVDGSIRAQRAGTQNRLPHAAAGEWAVGLWKKQVWMGSSNQVQIHGTNLLK